MGTSASVNCQLKDNICISYSDNDVNAGLLHDELINSGHNMVKYSFDINIDTLSIAVDHIMSQSSYIIICISDKTVSSFKQAIEINAALASNKSIIYVMTDAHYTPLNTSYLNAVVKYNKWLPAYDNDTLAHMLDELDVILHKND